MAKVSSQELKATNILKRYNLSITRPRIEIIHYLLENHGPFLVEDIFQNLPGDTCDLATLYRSLKKFEEAGVVQKCDFGERGTRYELKDSNHHHHHFLCKICERVEVLEGLKEGLKDCFLEEFENFLNSRGYKDIRHFLEFSGICPTCQTSGGAL